MNKHFGQHTSHKSIDSSIFVCLRSYELMRVEKLKQTDKNFFLRNETFQSKVKVVGWNSIIR